MGVDLGKWPRVGVALLDTGIGSERQPVGSSRQRTRCARVSSMPSTRVGGGQGNHRAAAVTSASCAMSQLTQWAALASATARFDPAIAVASWSRSRSVSRDRGGIAAVVSVNDNRARAVQTQPAALAPPQPHPLPGRRQVLDPYPRAVLDSGRLSSAARTSGLQLGGLDDDLDKPVSDATTSTTLNSSRPNSNDVGSLMFVASLADSW